MPFSQPNHLKDQHVFANEKIDIRAETEYSWVLEAVKSENAFFASPWIRKHFSRENAEIIEKSDSL